jgi:2,5-diamino-6-(ribosylamino)-4(3H)-pyrimidinone 5'-phosphate reductase
LLLEELTRRFGAQTVRVEAGGTLNGVLLEQGLVDEVGVLIHPVLAGGTNPTTMFQASSAANSPGVTHLHLTNVQRLEDDYVWLRYDVHHA